METQVNSINNCGSCPSIGWILASLCILCLIFLFSFFMNKIPNLSCMIFSCMILRFGPDGAVLYIFPPFALQCSWHGVEVYFGILAMSECYSFVRSVIHVSYPEYEVARRVVTSAT